MTCTYKLTLKDSHFKGKVWEFNTYEARERFLQVAHLNRSEVVLWSERNLKKS